MKSLKLNRLVKAAGICAGLGVLSGCAGPFNPINNISSQQIIQNNYPQISAQNVVVASNTPNCTYSKIGTVSVRGVNVLGISRSWTDIKSDMQQEAANMNGNVVIGVGLGGSFNQFYQGNIVYIPNIQSCTLRSM